MNLISCMFYDAMHMPLLFFYVLFAVVGILFLIFIVMMIFESEEELPPAPPIYEEGEVYKPTESSKGEIEEVKPSPEKEPPSEYSKEVYYCPRCGAKLEEEYKYCPICGYNLTE